MSLDGPNTKKKTQNKSKKKGGISLNVSNTRYDVVRRVGESLGYSITLDNADSFIIWSDGLITAERCAELKPYQRINHFPGMGEIARKDCLARNLQKMQKSYGDEYDFFPRTWNLPSDYTSLTNYYHELKKKKKVKTFICKPANGAMGNGIHLIQNLDKISMHDHLVIQEYLDRPLIVDGMKFDLRIYVLVLSCDPLKIFIYDDGLMRFSTNEYSPPTEKNLGDVYMHLTNYSINKSNDNYEACDEEDKGSKRTIKHLKNWMANNGYNFTTLWNRITDIVIKTVIVAEPYLLHAYRMARPGTTAGSSDSVCFEVLGMDIFIDRKLRPWLLEVNRSPSFGCETKVDNDIKFDVIRTTFKLLNLKPCEKKRTLAAQKELSRARLLRPKNNTERKSQFVIRKTYLKTQLNELRRVSEQTKFEDKHGGHYQRILPARGPKQEEYVNLLNGAFRIFLAGRGCLLEQDSHQGMLQHLRESELLDMLQQCENEEIDALTKAPSKTLKNVQPLSKLRPYSSPPISPSTFSRHTASPTIRFVNNATNSPMVVEENFVLKAVKEREDQLTKKTLSALHEMRIKFPGKDSSDTERLLKELTINWKYHKPRIASYWLVKLDSVKRKKLIDIVRDSVGAVVGRVWTCKGNTEELRLQRLFYRVYNRMLWSHGQGLWTCFSTVGASWEVIFSKGGDTVSSAELNCCRRVVQLCKECLQIVYIYSSEVGHLTINFKTSSSTSLINSTTSHNNTTSCNFTTSCSYPGSIYTSFDTLPKNSTESSKTDQVYKSMYDSSFSPKFRRTSSRLKLAGFLKRKFRRSECLNQIPSTNSMSRKLDYSSQSTEVAEKPESFRKSEHFLLPHTFNSY